MSDTMSRRDVVTKLAVGTAAVCAVGVAGTSLAATRERRTMPSGEWHGPGGSDAMASEPSLAPAPQAPPLQQASPPQDQLVDSGPPETLSAPAPWELVRPLAMGSMVAHGWRVAGLTGAVDGSCVLTLQNERGRSHRVHVCRNDGRPLGLVYTDRLDLLVMNGGKGDLPTEEGFAQAVAELAHVLAANESDRRHRPVVAALLPHVERVERFASAAKLR